METETGVAPLVKDNIDSGIPLELPQIDGRKLCFVGRFVFDLFVHFLF